MSSSKALTRRALILAVVAGGLIRLLFGDAYLAYVKPGMRIPLLLSAIAIGTLALASALAADDPDRDEHDQSEDDHGHDHSGLPRIGWWLVVPVACIAVVPIHALGSDSVRDRRANELTASRLEARAPAPDEGGSSVDGGEMTMLDFVSRVVNEPDRPVAEPVTLTGFVLGETTDGFVLARFVMSCCAADAQPLLATVRWYDVPPTDAWVEVTGTHVPAAADTPGERRIEPENIVVDATSVTEIDAPKEPYETY